MTIAARTAPSQRSPDEPEQFRAIRQGRLHREWPGAKRRFPRLWDRSYMVHRRLAPLLFSALRAAAGPEQDAVLVDVGCGSKPYYPLCASLVQRYIGLDAVPGATVDVVSTGECLPLGSGIADIVLSTHMLEHANDPRRTLGEMRRVLKPGGTLCLSTLGVWVYHPTPDDYWRWTHAGLRKLLCECGFQDIHVEPVLGTAGTLAYLWNTLSALAIDRAARLAGAARPAVQALGAAGIATINLLGALVDDALPATRDLGKSNTLIGDYLVVARKGFD